MDTVTGVEHADASALLEATAYWTAAVRARESARPDPLLLDPWAPALAGDVGMAWIAPRPDESVVPIVIRTRYFDDFLQRTTHEQGISQVVLLAAGLDTRAFRLDWPAGTRCFEVDQPAVLAHKARVMQAAGAQPACQRHAIDANLAGPWAAALVAGGFDPRQPAVWLLEGFLFYLPNETMTQVLDTVSGLAAAGSWLGFDIINGAMLTSPLTRAWIEMQARAGAPWIGTLDDPAAFLAQRGWQAALTQAGAPDAHYGRWPHPVLPTLMPNVPHNWFVTARYGQEESGA